jgi:hypothetical protein
LLCVVVVLVIFFFFFFVIRTQHIYIQDRARSSTFGGITFHAFHERRRRETRAKKKQIDQKGERERKRQKTQFECFFKNSNKNEQVLCFRENKTISFFFHHLKTTSQFLFFFKIIFFLFFNFNFFFCGKKKNVEKCNSNSKKKRNMKEGTVQYNSKKRKHKNSFIDFCIFFTNQIRRECGEPLNEDESNLARS